MVRVRQPPFYNRNPAIWTIGKLAAILMAGGVQCFMSPSVQACHLCWHYARAVLPSCYSSGIGCYSAYSYDYNPCYCGSSLVVVGAPIVTSDSTPKVPLEDRVRSLEDRVKKLEAAPPATATPPGATGATSKASTERMAQMLQDEDAAFRKMLEQRLAARAATSTGSGGETETTGPRVVTVREAKE